MRQVSFLIKPASGNCNMRCKYCFYEDTEDLRSSSMPKVMALETAENIIRKAFDVMSVGGAIAFCFQGGEPSLCGLSFFEEFVSLVKQYQKPGVTVTYAFQTNGTLIDTKWARFFRRNHFLIGVSIDGTEEIHDYYRQDAGCHLTYEKAKETFQLLNENGVDANILCVVTRRVAENSRTVYENLKALGGAYLQFIPCLDPYLEERGKEEWSLTPERYGSFLSEIFDLWYADWKNHTYTSIRLFEDYIHILTGEMPSTCSTSGRCGSYMVVESDGSVYPCDFYVLPEKCMGSINQNSVDVLLSSEMEKQFLEESYVRPEACKSCQWGSLCRGGCRRDWTIENEKTKNYYCPSFQFFFKRAIKRLMEIADAEMKAHMQYGR